MKKENIVIIGMGFLATYVMPCYKKLLGDSISTHVVGIKGSERGLKEKQAECPFPIQAGGVRETLEAKRPDLIILAVKPNQIAEMTEGTLKPYYEMLRKQGEELPDLYSFAPNPPVSYYYDTLGEDVNAANLLPNMMSMIEGHDVSQTGVSFAAFDPRRIWPEDRKKRALEFLTPTGTVLEIAGNKANSFLALQVACHLMFEFNYIAQDVAKKHGMVLTLEQTASAYRALWHKYFHDPCVEVLPCSENAVSDETLKEFMELAERSWYQGVLRFARSVEIPEEAAERMVGGSIEVLHMEAQLEPKEVLLQNTKNHATPGGYLEMCMIAFQKEGYAYIETQMDRWMNGDKDPGIREKIEELGFFVAKTISDHGETVSGIK